MMKLLVVVFVGFVVVGAVPVPGSENLSTLHNILEAEPHRLEGAMNAIPSHKSHVIKPFVPLPATGTAAIMFKSKPVTETLESQINGQRNLAHLEQRQQENNNLPPPLKHKKLSDIWLKETPCTCPFTKWQPVCGVDGNTYPTECFANCISVSIFVHADCRYVRTELWAKLAEAARSGKVPTDAEELCEQGDDDGDDPRRKCTRTLKTNEVVEVGEPFDEDDTTTTFQQQQATTIQQQQTTTNNLIDATPPQKQQPEIQSQETQEEPEIQEGDIEWRIFHGVKVPFYTHDVPNPCPSCQLSFEPVCGNDNKTYPSRCFADCVGVVVDAEGECQE